MKKANAILTADWHLREDAPICRTDDYDSAQWKKVDFISDLQKEHNCPVFHAGDLFNHWKPSPELLSKAIQHLPHHFYTVYGNHDLPQHNLELAHKCGIYTLERAGKLLTQPTGFNDWGMCHWNELPNGKHKILIWHTFTYKGEEPWPGCTDPKARSLIRKYPQYDLIVTGDNHKPFVEEYQGRLLVNPGSLMRMDVTQIDFEPRVYLWYADTNTVEPVFPPIEKDVISSKHIEFKKERDERITAFISQLNTDFKTSISFEENLRKFEQENNVDTETMQIIYNAIGL